MLRLQKHLVISFRHQCLLSTSRFATATTASATGSPDPPPFAVKDYLVGTCHLTPAQALKASKVLSHLKSLTRPDAVVAFLSGLGLSDADIAAAVAYDPKLLCAEAERTLAPRLAELRDLGFSPSQIARLVLVDPTRFRLPSVVSKLRYYVALFGTFENLLHVLKRNSYLLGSNLEWVVKPNVGCLMECGLHACDIAKLSVHAPRLITASPERVRMIVERADAIGVPRGTRMFRHVLFAVKFFSKEKIASKVEFLKKTFQWSDADVGYAVSKMPQLFRYSNDRLHCISEFLIGHVGLEPEYIARVPYLISLSLERRLRPRHYVVKFLKENGLLDHRRSYYTAVQATENVFLEKFICPYKEAAPSLAEDCAATCRGEVPATFRYQETKQWHVKCLTVL